MRQHGDSINGIADRDRSELVAAFFAENGNPIVAIGLDRGGRAQLALDSSERRKVFVVDGKGI